MNGIYWKVVGLILSSLGTIQALGLYHDLLPEPIMGLALALGNVQKVL